MDNALITNHAVKHGSVFAEDKASTIIFVLATLPMVSFLENFLKNDGLKKVEGIPFIVEQAAVCSCFFAGPSLLIGVVLALYFWRQCPRSFKPRLLLLFLPVYIIVFEVIWAVWKWNDHTTVNKFVDQDVFLSDVGLYCAMALVPFLVALLKGHRLFFTGLLIVLSTFCFGATVVTHMAVTGIWL